ncbi:MAG: lipocalin family protein [Polaribacter sp.]
MKKIIVIAVILLASYSCTTNTTTEQIEELEQEVANTIVGVWKLKSVKTLGQEFINACKSKNNIEVRSDNTFTITGHNEDDNCAANSSTGSWSYNSNSIYKFTAAGDTQTFTLTADNSLIFSFQQDSNTVIYSYKKD